MKTATASAPDLTVRASTFAWSSEAKRLGGLYRWLAIVLWCQAVADVAGAGSYGAQTWLYTGFEDDTWNDYLNFIYTALGYLSTITAALSTICFWGAVVLFCIFVYRASSNLHKSNAHGISATPISAVVYFFIPLLNLWKPFQAMSEIWRASHDPEGTRRTSPPASYLLGLWWAMWIASSIASGVTDLLLRRAGPDADLSQTTAWLYPFYAALNVVAVWALVAIIKRISQAQDRQFDISAFSPKIRPVYPPPDSSDFNRLNEKLAFLSNTCAPGRYSGP